MPYVYQRSEITPVVHIEVLPSGSATMTFKNSPFEGNVMRLSILVMLYIMPTTTGSNRLLVLHILSISFNPHKIPHTVCMLRLMVTLTTVVTRTKRRLLCI